MAQSEEEDAMAAATAAASHFEDLRRFVDGSCLNGGLSLSHAVQESAHVAPVQTELGIGRAETEAGQADTTNDAFNKLATVLCYLCSEAQRLQRHAEEQAYPLLLMFGEGCPKPPEPAAALVAALPALRDVVDLADALQRLALNLLCQLGGLCAEHTRKATILQGEAAQAVFLATAEVLGALLRLECLAQHAAALKPAFAALRRVLGAASEDSELWGGASDADSAAVASEVVRLEGALLGGSFRALLEGPLAQPAMVQLFAGGVVQTVFPTVTRGLFGDVLGRWGTAGAAGGHWPRLTGLLALSVAQIWLAAGQADRRLLRTLQDLHQQAPLLHLWSEAAAAPATLLARFLPPTVAALLPMDLLQSSHFERLRILDASAEEGATDMRQYALAAMAWGCSLDAAFMPQRSDSGTLERGEAALLHGVQLAASVRRWAQLPPLLAAQLQMPLSAAQATHLARAVALLKGMEAAFDRQGAAIAVALPHLLSAARARLVALAHKIASSAGPGISGSEAGNLFRALTGTGRKHAADLEDVETVAAFVRILTEGSLECATVVQLRLCADALRATGAVSDSKLARLSSGIAALADLADIKNGMHQACSCEWLWFSRHSLQSMAEGAVRDAGGAARLPRLLAAFADGAALLPHCSPYSSETLQAYDDFMYSKLELGVLLPAAAAIETELRLQQFAVSEASDLAAGGSGEAAAAARGVAAEAVAEARWVAPLAALPPLRLVTSTVSIRQWLGDKLSATLYENAAVAPQDGPRLRELAAMAAEHYGIPVAPPHLPAVGPAAGLDILEVMSNLDVFAACFAYSAATHSFVQRPGAAPRGAAYLSVLTVDAVAAAARAHGLALLPAVVNAVYKFLARRITALSQVLFSEVVRGRLLTEARWWAGARGGLQSLYPPQRAARLASDIAALAAPPEGPGEDTPRPQTLPLPLDQLRLIVTECGNVLGLVRVARQAGLRVATLAEGWAPPLAPGPPQSQRSAGNTDRPAEGAAVGAGEVEPPQPLEGAAEAEGLGPAGCAAAAALDALFADLHAHATEGLDFFPPLLPIFTKELCTPSNRHLRAFHMAVPALVAAAVEAALVAKEALARRRRGPAAAGFTDDGFPLGLVFLLKVLEQETAFDGLQWFQSVGAHYKKETADVAARSPSKRPPLQVASTAGNLATRLFDSIRGAAGAAAEGSAASPAEEENRQLLLERIRNYSAEYEQLGNTLAGMRMFFAETEA